MPVLLATEGNRAKVISIGLRYGTYSSEPTDRSDRILDPFQLGRAFRKSASSELNRGSEPVIPSENAGKCASVTMISLA